ncbi:unnamed protein product, partial [Heterosigma akashiwo]
MLLKIFWLLCPGLISVAHCFHHAAVRPVHTRSPFQLQSSILTDDIVFAPSEVEDTGRLVAIGDVHGDMKCLHRCLRIAGLMDNKGHWSGGNSVCVQVGDIFDRGDDDYYILQKIHQLNEEAQEQGGALISILGNHEVMSIRANHKFVTPRSCIPFLDMKQELDEFLEGDWSAFEHLPELERCRAAAFMPGGILSKKMALHPAVIKVGSTLFCPRGLARARWRPHGAPGRRGRRGRRRWIQGLGPFRRSCSGASPAARPSSGTGRLDAGVQGVGGRGRTERALEATLALTAASGWWRATPRSRLESTLQLMGKFGASTLVFLNSTEDRLRCWRSWTGTAPPSCATPSTTS